MRIPVDARHAGERRPVHIALLGAASTGKTRLASDLRVALAGNNSPTTPLQISDSPSLPSLLPTLLQHDWPAHTHVLLMGLDLPVSQGICPSQAAVDLDLRQTLTRAQLPYSVVYGLGAARLHHALDALQTNLPGRLSIATGAGNRQRPWVWACDSCSDPGCERRLLSALLAARSS